MSLELRDILGEIEKLETNLKTQIETALKTYKKEISSAMLRPIAPIFFIKY